MAEIIEYTLLRDSDATPYVARVKRFCSTKCPVFEECSPITTVGVWDEEHGKSVMVDGLKSGTSECKLPRTL